MKNRGRRLGKRCVRWEERESEEKQYFEEGMEKTRHQKVQMEEESSERRKPFCCLSFKWWMERGMNVGGVFKALQLC